MNVPTLPTAETATASSSNALTQTPEKKPYNRYGRGSGRVSQERLGRRKADSRDKGAAGRRNAPTPVRHVQGHEDHARPYPVPRAIRRPEAALSGRSLLSR
jgi:hypothetical protein